MYVWIGNLNIEETINHLIEEAIPLKNHPAEEIILQGSNEANYPTPREDILMRKPSLGIKSNPSD
jgi:hypothetical protein